MSIKRIYFLLCLLLIGTVEATVPQNAKIVLLIHSDFIRNAVKEAFKEEGFLNVVSDRVTYDQLEHFFAAEKPQYVVLDSSGSTVDQQLAYETKAIALAYHSTVQKLIALSFFSVYPEKAALPLQESSLNAKDIDKALQTVTDPYSLAKLTLLRHCHAANANQAPRFVFCPYPYIYGPNDPNCKIGTQFGTSHPLYHIVSRIQQAINEHRTFTVIANDGTARYELLHCKDLGRAIATVLCSSSSEQVVNLSSGRDSAMFTLTELASKLSGYKGEVLLDINCYDEVKRRVLSPSLVMSLGFTPVISYQEGFAELFD